MRKQPLRQWSAPSYSAQDGRAAKSSEEQRSGYGADGETWTVNAQIPSAFAGRDRRCTQNPVPVSKRPFQTIKD
jgi:hypothetical protein